MIIYKITNNLNGKSYIGQTKRTVAIRVRDHIRNKSKIGRAMVEDGEENFDISVIDQAETQEELDELERFWIAFYNTQELGYNTLSGGKPTKKEFKTYFLSNRRRKTKQNKKRKHTRRFLKRKKESLYKWLDNLVHGVKKRRKDDKQIYDEYLDVYGRVPFIFPESGKLTKIQRAIIINGLVYNTYGIKNFIYKPELWWSYG